MSRNCKTCADISCPYKSYNLSTGCVCYTPKSSLQRELEELNSVYERIIKWKVNI